MPDHTPDSPACTSRRAHEGHNFPTPDGGTRYCGGYDPAKADPVGDVTSGRGLGRLFERKESETP